MNKEAVPSNHFDEISEQASMTGSTLMSENPLTIVNQSLDLFFKSLKLGRVRGLVDIISDSDDLTVLPMIRQLVQRDILVSLSGNRADLALADLFESVGDGLAEFCNFIGVDPVLQIDLSDNPEILNFYNEIVQHEQVNISDLPIAVVAPGRYREQAESSDAILTVGEIVENTPNRIDMHIHEKRLALGWCDRCGGCFSPFS